jgi:molybdate transport system substrate-binding protein
VFRTALGRAAALALALSLSGPGTAAAGDVTVFAAASLTTAMTEIAGRFEADTGHDVTLSLAGSSALARQIRQGAPADVFISANPGWMDAVEEAGLIAPGTRVDLLGNALVLVAADPAAAPLEIGPRTDLAGRLDGGRLAMALVDAVPAGLYGKAALETLGLWAELAPRVVQADNVRAALALVALGEAPYGIVYATDARAEDDVTVVGRFPPGSHPPVIYPAAGLRGRTGPAAADFLAYLRGPGARAVFEAEGFVMAGE